jgi:pimeloyl-ACP methyl ester carboxylesterase
VLAAAEDILTPVAGARELAEAIPGAHLHILPKGSHVTAAEYPGEVSAALLEFLLA